VSRHRIQIGAAEVRTVRLAMVMLGACQLALGIVWMRRRVPAHRDPRAAHHPSNPDPVRAVLVGGALVVIGGVTLWLAVRG
jgi:hypothetical protein